jgi:hypothetical protein
MSAKEWVLSKKKAWELRFFTDDPVKAMKVPGGPGKNLFTLQPVKRKKKIICLKVTFKKNAMADCWKDVYLFPRGNKPAPQPVPALPLAPTEAEDTAARTALETYVTNLPLSTERLEGDMTVPDKNGVKVKGAVTLIQIPKALGGKKAWLAVYFVTDTESPGGTGGGGHT